MKNYFEFELNDKIVKAYTTLENLFEIESAGINLAQTFLNILNGKILSFTDARKILNLAIKADLENIKDRAEFVKDYFEFNKFKACDQVSAFILEAVKTPTDKDNLESEASEKK